MITDKRLNGAGRRGAAEPEKVREDKYAAEREGDEVEERERMPREKQLKRQARVYALGDFFSQLGTVAGGGAVPVKRYQENPYLKRTMGELERVREMKRPETGEGSLFSGRDLSRRKPGYDGEREQELKGQARVYALGDFLAQLGGVAGAGAVPAESYKENRYLREALASLEQERRRRKPGTAELKGGEEEKWKEEGWKMRRNVADYIGEREGEARKRIGHFEPEVKELPEEREKVTGVVPVKNGIYFSPETGNFTGRLEKGSAGDGSRRLPEEYRRITLPDGALIRNAVRRPEESPYDLKEIGRALSGVLPDGVTLSEALSDQRAQVREEEAAKGGFWDSYAGDWIERIGAGTADMGGTIYSILDKLVKLNNPLLEIDIEKDPAYQKWCDEHHIPETLRKLMAGNNFFKQQADDAYAYAAELERRSVRNGGKGFEELWSEGDYAGAAGDVFLHAAETLPLSLIGMLGGPVGIVFSGVSAGVGKYDQLDRMPETKNMAEYEKIINAVSTGTFEALTNKLGSIPMGEWIKSYEKMGAKAMETSVRKGLSRWMQDVFKRYGVLSAPIADGAEEAFSQVAENITDYCTGVTKEWNPMENVFESFVYGTAGSVEVSAVRVPYAIKKWNDGRVERRQQRKISGQTENASVTDGGVVPREAGTEIGLPDASGSRRTGDSVLKDAGERMFQPVGRNVFGDVYDQFRGKPERAFEFLDYRKGDVAEAVFNRAGLGDVDVVWGSPNGQVGLASMKKRFVGKPGGFASVKELARAVEAVIENGTVRVRKGGKMTISLGGYRVFLRNTANERNGNGVKLDRWTVTGFEPGNKEGSLHRGVDGGVSFSGPEGKLPKGRLYPGGYEPEPGVGYVDRNEQMKVLNEIAEKEGLRGFFGEGLPDFYKYVCSRMGETERNRLMRMHGNNKEQVARDYLNRLVKGKGDPAVWEEVKTGMEHIFEKRGVELDVPDNDMKCLFWKAMNWPGNRESPVEIVRKLAEAERVQKELLPDLKK